MSSTNSPTATHVSEMPDLPERCDWAYVRQIAWRHKGALAVAQLVALLATAATIPVPLLFPILVDEVLLDQPGRALDLLHAVLPQAWHGPVYYIGAFLLTTFFLRVAVLGLNILQTRQFAIISGDITYRLRRALLGKLGRISLSEYETLGGGGVASHFITDLSTVEQFVTSTVGRFVVNVFTLIGIAGVLLWMNWQLALFILLLNPPVVYLTTLLGKRIKKLKLRENSAVEAFQGALTETLDAIHQLRASNRERPFLARLAGHAGAVRDRAVDFEWKSKAANRSSFLVLLYGFDVFRAASMLAVLFSDLTVGQMMAVFSYLWFLMGPIQELLSMQYSYYAADAALGRVDRLLHREEEPRFESQANPFSGKKTVGLAVRDLRFAYVETRGRGPGPAPGGLTRDRSTEILRGIDLDIAPGEKVALVGASGGGKSTFVQMLLGLYPATSGRILFDGVPAEEIGWQTVRDHVVTVLQHPALFNDTVRLNLTLGTDQDDARIWHALEIAQLADEIRQLEGGLDASVGVRGTRLSGGQRQRLAIARMLLADPSIIILDEATSALDLETEDRLQRALARELEGRTTLIIAHRLSALRMADRALVFEAGRIGEQGTHGELVQKGGLYAALYGQATPEEDRSSADIDSAAETLGVGRAT